MPIPKKKTLDDQLEIIANNVDTVGVKPYSDILINLALRAIAEKYGKEKANAAIEEFSLDRLGWKKEK